MVVLLEKIRSKKAEYPKSNKPLNSYLQYASLSFQMMAIIGVSVWAGLALDQYLQLGLPVFVSIFSVGATVLTVYLTVKKLTKVL